MKRPGPENPPDAQDVYSQLAPFVREYVYEKKWEALTGVQEAAVRAVLHGKGQVLIASGTASGKTEAAFFPVLSLLARNPPASVGVLYIGPLKALINDQFERLGPLFNRGGIPVLRWHGDIPGEHKKKFLGAPGGVLQITPESLEALLLKRPGKLIPLFGDLRFVIIDEVHAFMGSDRGAQILCQIGRIEEAAGIRIRRIGLSATLGDYGEALRWLALGTGGETVLVREEGRKQRVRLRLDYFNREDPREGEAYYRELYGQCRGKRCIIFTNSRLEAEETVARLREMAGHYHEDDVFYVHHGSVSAALREEAEGELREREGPVVIAATATLELGIDIGSLDRVIQIGPPPGVSRLVQRLGRSGRRTGRAEIYFACPEDAREGPAADPLRAIPWSLLKTIAVIELYLKEKWMEGAPVKPLPYSLLCHQTLSFLSARGESSPRDLARRVLSLPPFAGIPPEDYRELLRRLITLDYLEKTEGGGLIIGLEGEKIVNHYSFYSVFPDEEAYRVTQGGKELGKIHFIPPEGTNLVLGGRYWQVRGFDLRGREILVIPGEEGGERVWRGSRGETHSRIVERMREILAAGEPYPYLSETARFRLDEGRDRARELKLTEDYFVPVVPGGFFFIPWLGSRAMRTLAALFRHREIRKRLGMRSCSREKEPVFRIGSGLPIPEFRNRLAGIIDQGIPPDAVSGDIPLTDKYDYLLPPALLGKQYAANMLDMGELAARFGGVVS
ncbi:MAG: DEAD/DEAH box helicase [Spirochaetaceae bacterium]|jgi:ATP-dependent Lhr-like helicase|nr:DEAD/DEAH box helicase [Spirochaetaceae bacterium]